MYAEVPHPLAWRVVATPPSLGQKDLHLWRIPLHQGGPDTDGADLGLLSERQRERLERLRSFEHRQRYLRAQAGCRRILALYLGVSPTEVSFRYGPAGKPALCIDGKRIEFNLTTSGNLALLGVSADLSLGVDCELESERVHMLDIAGRMFGADIKSALAALQPEPRKRLFHLHWTALEARVKADGRGLSRHREPDPTDLRVAHACAGEIDAKVALCAVARRELPPPHAWQALELVGRETGGCASRADGGQPSPR
jgi:4'-phosphopantetheinyl transferase